MRECDAFLCSLNNGYFADKIYEEIKAAMAFDREILAG